MNKEEDYVYVLYSTEQWEGGVVHGVFTTKDKAQQAWLEGKNSDVWYETTQIKEIKINQFLTEPIKLGYGENEGEIWDCE